MKGFSSAKLILLQPSTSFHKSPSSFPHHHHRLFLVGVISFFTFASLFTLLTTTTRTSSSSPPDPIHNRYFSSPSNYKEKSSSYNDPNSNMILVQSPQIHDALLHYAVSTAPSSSRMPEADIRAIASVVRRRAPCNLLVFGLGFETLLWRSLNLGGRTVILDENEYFVKHYEDRHPGIEAYDVSYSTRVRQLRELLADARGKLRTDCRPVQNLLFSDCRLGINDLPNNLYDVAWDVILVDGPRGYEAESPGRMAAIFTAAVMARTSEGKGKTDVLVHDLGREVERVCSEEFLCGENLVGVEGQLGHFVISHGGGDGKHVEDFCFNRSVGLPPVGNGGGGRR